MIDRLNISHRPIGGAHNVTIGGVVGNPIAGPYDDYILGYPR